ncbi:MAG: NAD(P)-dependent glycerol-3-phosphate dehydrogenase [Corynebacteriales bacterium]|nr:NAD(P)-dependent glycerol-3-phosphate dehydrogenase [Mycobacteriales bacterium]
MLGAGSWGTTFAKVLADSGQDVMVWGRRQDVALDINKNHANTAYLPDIALPEAMQATTDVAEALRGTELVVLAVPSQTMRENVTQWAHLIPERAVVLSLAKGIELGTGLRMSEVITEVGDIPADRVAVLSGPNLAREIAEEKPAATVIACQNADRARWLQEHTATSYLRPYSNMDVIGCELAGAMKNVIALACGMADGLNLGDNSKASLMTRGLAEMTRLGLALGAQAQTFSGLAGMGDLIATCASGLSRNHRFGEFLARGHSLESARLATGQTAEGVVSCVAIAELAGKVAVELPITQEVMRVCHEGRAPQAALAAFMARDTRAED